MPLLRVPLTSCTPLKFTLHIRHKHSIKLTNHTIASSISCIQLYQFSRDAVINHLGTLFCGAQPRPSLIIIMTTGGFEVITTIGGLWLGDQRGGTAELYSNSMLWKGKTKSDKTTHKIFALSLFSECPMYKVMAMSSIPSASGYISSLSFSDISLLLSFLSLLASSGSTNC